MIMPPIWLQLWPFAGLRWAEVFITLWLAAARVDHGAYNAELNPGQNNDWLYSLYSSVGTAKKEMHLSHRRKPLGFPSGRLASPDRHRAISITDELWAKASVWFTARATACRFVNMAINVTLCVQEHFSVQDGEFECMDYLITQCSVDQKVWLIFYHSGLDNSPCCKVYINALVWIHFHFFIRTYTGTFDRCYIRKNTQQNNICHYGMAWYGMVLFF